MEIVKKHDAIITEVFESESALNAHEKECAKYRAEWLDIYTELKERVKHAESVRGSFSTFCPHVQYIRVDFLKPEDWPNNISDNSAFVDFVIDLKAQTIEVSRYGHIWLSLHDQKKSFLAMCSMRDAAKAVGHKWLRKYRYADTEKLAAKVCAFIEDVFDGLNRATTGYPYKQMAIDIY